jgi:hypothetical protein
MRDRYETERIMSDLEENGQTIDSYVVAGELGINRSSLTRRLEGGWESVRDRFRERRIFRLAFRRFRREGQPPDEASRLAYEESAARGRPLNTGPVSATVRSDGTIYASRNGKSLDDSE